MTNYTIVLMAASGNRIIDPSSTSITDQLYSFVYNGLMEYSLYVYYAIATNIVGDSEPSISEDVSTCI